MGSETIIFNGMIIGMLDMGAQFVEFDGIDIFFDIPKDSEINDNKKLTRCRDAWGKEFGIKLKVKYLK